MLRPGGFPPWFWPALVIITTACCVYWPTLPAGWYGDDEMYLLKNPLMHDPHRLWKTWFQPGSFIEYYPLTETVQWCQWQLWDGGSALGYRLTNFALHLTSALLIWRLLSKFGLKLAWLGGLLFAIHPMLLDSVAVASELKNTLSLPPFLLAICLYLDFEEKKKPRYYLGSLAMFLVAMLCKITMSFFPLMIPLYAWWKRGRITLGDLKAALPFLVIAAGLSLISIKVGFDYAKTIHYLPPGPMHLGGFFSRMALGGLSLAFYFASSVLPIDPMPIYPLWPVDPPSLPQFAPWLVFALVLRVCWSKRHDWGRHVLLGLAFFTLALLPFLGFEEVTYMCLSWVFDHLLYIPIIGIIALVVAGLEQAGRQLPRRFLPLGAMGIALAVALLAFRTYSYAEIFADQEQLWRYNLQQDDMWFVRYRLGSVLITKGRFEEASEQLKQSIQANPDFSIAHYDLGYALNREGHPTEAIDSLQAAIKINPDYALAHNELGSALGQTGHLPEAIEQFEAAVRLKPDFAEAHYNLGVALQMTGRLSDAIEHFRDALRLNPHFTQAQQSLDQALAADAAAKPK